MVDLARPDAALLPTYLVTSVITCSFNYETKATFKAGIQAVPTLAPVVKSGAADITKLTAFHEM